MAIKKVVKTRQSRFINRITARYNDATSKRWLGVVPKSVALYNMCGDNAYERRT